MCAIAIKVRREHQDQEGAAGPPTRRRLRDQCEQLAAPMGSATNSRSDAPPLEPKLVKERPSGTAPLQSPATCTGTPATTPRVPQSTASQDGSGS